MRWTEAHGRGTTASASEGTAAGATPAGHSGKAEKSLYCPSVNVPNMSFSQPSFRRLGDVFNREDQHQKAWTDVSVFANFGSSRAEVKGAHCLSRSDKYITSNILEASRLRQSHWGSTKHILVCRKNYNGESVHASCCTTYFIQYSAWFARVCNVDDGESTAARVGFLAPTDRRFSPAQTSPSKLQPLRTARM